MSNWIGVDYGAKLSGNTAVCYNEGQKLIIEQVPKRKDADKWLKKLLEAKKFGSVYIDAPLSLPGRYCGLSEYTNFHYRRCDKALKAMSPLFLGGLTARAMQLADSMNIPFCEAYPKAFVSARFSTFKNYKRDRAIENAFFSALKELLPVIRQEPENNHQLDAMICWYIGYLKLYGQHFEAGEIEEGLIFY